MVWSHCGQEEVSASDVLDPEELADYYNSIGYEWWRETR